MNDLQQRIAHLPPDKRALLEQRLQEHLQEASGSSTIPRRATQGPAPLSFSQERLWFLAQLYPGQTNYNEASAYRFTGQLNLGALQAALNSIVHRHEILRTTYHSQDGIPLQVVGQPREVPLPIVDLSATELDERTTEAQGRFQEVIDEPFDLSSDLMVRACLYRLDCNDHILLTVRHHIASDGWSSRLFWNGLMELYAAATSGQSARMAPLPIQYADYAVWQREGLQGEQLERQLDYWRQQLADLPRLELPTDWRRPDTQTFQGAGERFLLVPDLVDKLWSLAREEATTPHTVLLAAYVVLLHRTAAQDDIAIGTPTAGRIRAELEPLIGFFVNTLIVRAKLGDDPSFRSLLRQMRGTTLAALDHQDIPFAKLVEVLEPERHLNRSPLIATTFQLLDLPQAGADLPGLTVSPINVPNLHAKFDMECSLVATTGGVSGHWRYATDLFRADTIRRMIGHYQTLLAAISDDPDCAISQLPMLTEAERQQVQFDWNSTPDPTIPTQVVHQLFEAQAARTADALAVVAENQQLTYRELNQRANQVAYRLQELRVEPETAVGLYVGRTVGMIVGLLGILKAGGTFVPLDPAAPPARLRMLAEDAGIQVVLTTAEHLPKWPVAETPTVCLDGDQWAAFPTDPNPVPAARDENAAYILYTSGSTGKPKGVIVEHRQLLSYVCAAVDQYGMAQGGTFAMVQPLTVDSCHTMIFPSLGWGGTLHLINRERALDAAALSSYFQRHRIDFLKISPAHLHALLIGAEPGALLPRRCLIIGGQVFHWDLVEQLLALEPPCAIWNHYGPTETTVGVLTYPASSAGTAHRSVTASVPLGRPLPGVRIYILDRHGNPVPIGVTGELCVSGPFVARGYLNRPEQTAEQFREDSLSGDSGGRLYRTGDLARYLPDGVVEFLGRSDHQVKLRGYRVELGEIEAVLGQHPAIREVVALTREDAGTKNTLLVAYAVPGQGPVPTSGELRAFLKEKLPEYMVPSALVMLDDLPVTASGKVDRRALPAPEGPRDELEGTYMAPRTPVEEVLADIWSQVLGVEGIGVYDNFFEMGGHSLLATQIISRIRDRFGLEIPLRMIFDSPTVEGMAAFIRGQRSRPPADRQLYEMLAELVQMPDGEVDRLLLVEEAEMEEDN